MSTQRVWSSHPPADGWIEGFCFSHFVCWRLQQGSCFGRELGMFWLIAAVSGWRNRPSSQNPCQSWDDWEDRPGAPSDVYGLSRSRHIEGGSDALEERSGLYTAQ